MHYLDRRGAFYVACMVVLAVIALANWFWGKPVREPNICSLEYR
jgi:hypothetical protein